MPQVSPELEAEPEPAVEVVAAEQPAVAVRVVVVAEVQALRPLLLFPR